MLGFFSFTAYFRVLKSLCIKRLLRFSKFLTRTEEGNKKKSGGEISVVGTEGRNEDSQRLKANPPQNLNLKYGKLQLRSAWDSCLSGEGEIKPPRGGWLRLGRRGRSPKAQSDYNTSRALNGAISGFGQFYRACSASLAPGPRHRGIPLRCPGAAERAEPCWADAGSGWGDLPGGEGRGAQHPPSSLLTYGRDARLRRGEKPARRARGVLPAPGKATCFGKCLTASRGAGPCRCPSRCQRPPPPRSLAATPGTAGTLPLSRPSLNRRSKLGFLMEPRRGAGDGLEKTSPRIPTRSHIPTWSRIPARPRAHLPRPRGCGSLPGLLLPYAPDRSGPFSLVREVLESC